MRPKHHSAVVVGLLAASLAGTLSYGLWRVQDQAQRRVSLGLPRLQPAPVIPAAEREAVGRLIPRLARLVIPAATPAGEVDLMVFGHQPVRQVAGAGQAERPVSLGGHVVTMAFVAAASRFAVVDGRFLSQGAELEDGTQVARILQDRVLLDKHGVREWVPVSNPASDSVAAGDEGRDTSSRL